LFHSVFVGMVVFFKSSRIFTLHKSITMVVFFLQICDQSKESNLINKRVWFWWLFTSFQQYFSLTTSASSPACVPWFR